MPNRYALAVVVIMALALVVSAAAFAPPTVSGQGDAGDMCIILYPDGTWHYVACPATPTPDTLPTVTPPPVVATPTSTPAPICMIGAVDYNVNVRTVPGGKQIGLFEIGAATEAVAQTEWSGLRYWKIWWPFVSPPVYAWVADFVAETGPCDQLPVETPAPPFP